MHRQWCILEVSGEFVAAMDDVLAHYALPHDTRYPTVCLDEKPAVWHTDVRPTLSPAPGHVERRDDEYERHGTVDLFMLVEPLAGWRHVSVTEQRVTALDDERNALGATIEWQFTSRDARVKLKQRYPIVTSQSD